MPFLDIRPKYYLHGFDRSYRGVDLNVSKLSLRKLQFLTAIDHSFLVGLMDLLLSTSSELYRSSYFNLNNHKGLMNLDFFFDKFFRYRYF